MNALRLAHLICLLASIPARAATPSFDCKSAATPVEMAICNDQDLSRLDADLKPTFESAYAATSFKQALLAGQRAWLLDRTVCATMFEKADPAKFVGCLRERYDRRLAFLKRPFNPQDQNICRTLSDAITSAGGYIGPAGLNSNPIADKAVRDILGALTLEDGDRTLPGGLDKSIKQLDTKNSGFTRRYYVLGSKYKRIAVSDHSEGTLYCQISHYYNISNKDSVKKMDPPDGIGDGCGNDLTHFGNLPSGGPNQTAAYLQETPTIDNVRLQIGTWSGSDWSPLCEMGVNYNVTLKIGGMACEQQATCLNLSKRAFALAVASETSTDVDGYGKETQDLIGSAKGVADDLEFGEDTLSVGPGWYASGLRLDDNRMAFERNALVFRFDGLGLLFRISHGHIRDFIDDGYLVGVYRLEGTGLAPVASFEILKARTGLKGPIQIKDLQGGAIGTPIDRQLGPGTGAPGLTPR